MFKLFLNDAVTEQYKEKMEELERTGLGKRKLVNPWVSSNTMQVFKNISITKNTAIVTTEERDEIESYFDEYVLPAYDFTNAEADEMREQYVNTFKDMMGDMNFTQWLESVTPVIKPWQSRGVSLMRHNNDKEGFGPGR